MDAAQALADLMEISSQVQAAVLLDAAGEVEVAAGAGDERARVLAQAARELLEAAGRARPGGGEQAVTQLEAATRAGSLFVVREGERVIAAATAPSPTVGLVFYDLKTCLKALAPEEGAKTTPETKPRRAATATRSQQEGGNETP
jgi:predicted regulator of Ras-like GTPase activity (Roadblock/LC7/MglB family)